MLKRILLASACIIGIAAPAYAQEINTDIGCDNAAAWPSPGTGWAVTGSKCVATGATRMAMLMQMTTAAHKLHVYKITADYVVTSGSVRAFVGVKMPSAPVGTNVLASSVAVVADNFTTSLGLQASSGVIRSETGPGDDNERNGAWRVTCNSGGFKRVDSLVYPGLQAPHLHEFVGGTNMEPNWTYSDIRTKAQSSCTNMADPQHTINRSFYWFPAFVDGSGNPKRTQPMLVYYKGPSNPAQPASVALTGSISGTTLTVTATGGVTNPITPDGEVITGAGVTAHTGIIAQLSGTTDGIGTYTVDKSQTVGSETLTLISPHKDSGEADGTAASECAAWSLTTDCRNIPRGLRFTFGYKGSFNATADPANNCGPDDTTNVGSVSTERCSIHAALYGWTCSGGPNGEGGVANGVNYTATYNTLHEIMAAHVCVKGSIVQRAIGMANCWDGTYVDTPDHRAHMSMGNSNIVCLVAAHPIVLPRISLLLSYFVDQDFIDGKDHLSSDEMAACYDTGGLNGCTDHADYYEGWSDNCTGAQNESCSIRERWYQRCNFSHNTCTNDLGDGTLLKSPTTNFNGSSRSSQGIFQGPYQENEKERIEQYGMSPDVTATATRTFYITAVDDGVWGFLGRQGFTGTIDNIHVTDMGIAANGPVTVHQ